MKNTTLILFAALILFGWTALAVGVLSVFEGQPKFSAQSHQHLPKLIAPQKAKPIASAAQCPAEDGGNNTAEPCAV